MQDTHWTQRRKPTSKQIDLLIDLICTRLVTRDLPTRDLWIETMNAYFGSRVLDFSELTVDQVDHMLSNLKQMPQVYDVFSHRPITP